MGVPAFFRWLSQKYPKIISPVLEALPQEIDGHEIPVDTTGPNPNGEELDNLYLDMNGIVHPCSHPEDRPPPETEQEMMLEVFRYTERVVAMVRPRKVLMMAVDGVAPRAKMNQQRSRRFRSAQEAKEKEEQVAEFVKLLASKGTDIDSNLQKKGWDSNAITPGTPFMDILSIALKYWVAHKLNTDPGWAKLKIIISDSSVPGEGEHKIMEFVRGQRSHPEHDPNTRHVIYGLDADLIMLGLATHEPHFRVLREDVFAQDSKPRVCKICNQKGHRAEECTGKAREKEGEFDEKSKANPRKPFIWLDVGILREYLAVELHVAGLSFQWDLERAIDDWVFLCFFVGNDFLPHFPSLEIRDAGIDTLTSIWREKLAAMKGFVTTDGHVNLERAQFILDGLAKQEDAIFRKRRQVEERREANAKRRKLQEEANNNSGNDKISVHRGKSERIPTAHPANIPLFAPNDHSDKTKQLNHDVVVNRAEIRTANYANKSAAAALKAQLLQNTITTNPSTDEQPAETEAQPETEGASVLGKRKLDTMQADSGNQTPIEAAPGEGNTDTVKLWEPGYRDRYYEQKFGRPPSDTNFRREVANAYVEGLCWVLLYYFQGCPSWTWYYPYHYAPFAQDFENIGELKINFTLGKPFKPFEQLMGVLPAASKHNIPKAFWPLMTEENSEIIDFYPEDFPIDLNGKKFAWQGVAILPFIDETRLLDAMNKIYPQIPAEEKERNEMGNELLLFSESHPLYDELACQFFSKRAVDGDYELDPRLSEGLSGGVRKDPNFIPHSTVSFPFTNVKSDIYGDIEDDQSMSVIYLLPEKKNLHKSMLLRGVVLKTPALTEGDKDVIINKQQGNGNRYGGGYLDRSNSGRGRGGRHHYNNPIAPPSGVRGPSLPAGYTLPDQQGRGGGQGWTPPGNQSFDFRYGQGYQQPQQGYGNGQYGGGSSGSSGYQSYGNNQGYSSSQSHNRQGGSGGGYQGGGGGSYERGYNDRSNYGGGGNGGYQDDRRGSYERGSGGERRDYNSNNQHDRRPPQQDRRGGYRGGGRGGHGQGGGGGYNRGNNSWMG
ncbi:5'-3' exoribonuclease 2 [Orbilia oligospora]|nr:5'-3' exoribonuclease 2 [Orbilia oligospora]KAF3098361.1 5'-3' exoribonuclease 2 [Orbilia oligospora]KAF3129711.1 5'-3' exoribonuclease 2 [Orbilia oligospora]KAF3135070.1 5'-3' exoribonuclease 2 [Orbilia oligospora]